jgi:3-hydroxyisobutyrate dehydrogenase-like beta-hydroxyacid dehydrogenase
VRLIQKGNRDMAKTYEPSTPRKVAFLGLGVMGGPMAGHLQAAGHHVTVYNRTAAKAQAWVEKHGGAAAATPSKAVEGAEFVFCCVGNDADLRSVVTGDDGAFAGMARGAVLVDHTTASADIARELHNKAVLRGLHFVDAAPFEAMKPVAMAYARAVTRLGDSGSGQLAKMVNQICIAGLVQGLAEAVAFGAKAGLDMPAVLDVIGKGAAQSWQMDNRGKTMIADQFDFGFAVDWMRKDLGLVLDEARRNGARLPATALIDQFYAELQNRGGGRWDTSSLVKLLNK